MSAAVTAAGWIVAAGALALALATRRELAGRMERLARATHELRRPLTAARLAADGLAHANGDGPGRAASIEREIVRACRLLGDLDAVRGTTAIAFTEEPGLVVVAELLTATAGSWTELAAPEARRVVVEPWDEVLMVRGEAPRLEQALDNLVANALEHGKGTVRLAAYGGDGRVAIEVADAGAGLPAPLHDLIHGARAGRGTRGRGLAIAREIAAAHGGALRAEPGAARVVLELPAAAGTVAAVTHRSAA
jgi:signal transduction histidine kinase